MSELKEIVEIDETVEINEIGIEKTTRKKPKRGSRINHIAKRILDFSLTLIGTILISPVLLIIAILIKCSSKGPVLFKQERLGYRGKVFRILKFRTMVVNAEHMGTGVVINEKNDSRVTKIGRFLRSTSLDELPQVFNVLKGDMALVGPRPPVTYHPYDGYENYPEWAKKRFQMRPGMTGLVQTTIRSDASWDERMKIDCEYVDKFSVLSDIKILFDTVVTVIKGEAI